MFCWAQAFPQPGFRHEGVYAVGVGEEDGLGQDTDLDESGVEIAGESGGGGEEADGFGGGVD